MADDGVTVSFKLPAFVSDLMERFPLAASYVRWWLQLCYDNPVHLLVETTLIVFILYILLKRPNKKSKLEALPASVVQELIDEYEPEPLCPEVDRNAQLVLDSNVVIEQRPAKYTKIRGVDKDVLNLTTLDFLGLGQRKELHDAASAALDKYGCGSCGPRGFYGSIDVHVYLEQDLARFFGTEEAIVYSDASSTASSAIPAFSNRADLLVVDDGCNSSILTGVNLSRSRVLFFKHNDMDDLKRVLIKVEEEDKRLKRKPQRRFIVVEGLYRNFGDVAPLDEVFKLKNKYKWRLFLDESHSIGVFGATGRGVHEHFGVPVREIDLLVSSLSTTLGSVGGFCVGSREVVEHQRLSGAGYCFSASSPPFVSTAASTAIKIMEEEAKPALMPTLKRLAQLFHSEVNKQGKGYLVPVSNPASALVHVRLDPKFQAAASRDLYDAESRFREDSLLRKICLRMRDQGFLVTAANYVINPDAAQKIGSSPRPALPPPSLRLAITALHEESELINSAKALCAVAKEILEEAGPQQLSPAAAGDGAPAPEGLKKRK